MGNPTHYRQTPKIYFDETFMSKLKGNREFLGPEDPV